MTRKQACKLVRFFLHLHYDIKKDGAELLLDEHVHLLLPNHPAYIEPPMLFAEFPDATMRPMADERFFHQRIPAYGLRLAEAISVPDLPKTSADARERQAALARNLTTLAVQTLRAGKDLVFYPSGHVKLTPKESIGNRRLAYEVCSELFADEACRVHVIMLRTTGLDHSYTSRLRWKPTLRRHVHLHFEDMTEKIKEWVKLDKRSFNEKLEEWYNA